MHKVSCKIALKRTDLLFVCYSHDTFVIHACNRYCPRANPKVSWQSPASTSSYPSTCRPQAYHVQECDLDLGGMMGHREPREDDWVTKDILKSKVFCLCEGVIYMCACRACWIDIVYGGNLPTYNDAFSSLLALLYGRSTRVKTGKTTRTITSTVTSPWNRDWTRSEFWFLIMSLCSLERSSSPLSISLTSIKDATAFVLLLSMRLVLALGLPPRPSTSAQCLKTQLYEH